MSRRFAAALSAILVAAVGCSSAGTGSAAPSASTVPSPTATGAPRPTPTPIAVLDGEPWIVYTWAPTNGKGLYLKRPDGTDAHEIATDVPGEAGGPDWSPDGKLIAFELMVSDGVFEIWTVKADGSDPQKVLGCEAAPCVEVSSPAWSPDGKHLAFWRTSNATGVSNATGNYADDRFTLEVLDLATRTSHVIATAPPVGAEYVWWSWARWSPDGTQVVFVVNRYPMPPTDQNILGSSIAVVKTDGSEITAPRILTEPSLFGTSPDWSPDGTRIVFYTHGLGSFQDTTLATNLYTIRPDGTGLTQVTHFGENDTRATQPTWTPDGTRILFTDILRNASNPWGNRFPAFIDPDGSNLTVLSGHEGTHPRLRPTP